MTALHTRDVRPWGGADGMKALIDDRDPAWEWKLDNGNYAIYFDEGFTRFFCAFKKIDPTPDPSDQKEFEDNYLSDGSKGALSGEHPIPVSAGFNKKKDRTVDGNNITCPDTSTTTLCTRTVKAGKNVLIERIIISKDAAGMVEITVRNLTDSVTERRFWMDSHMNSVQNRRDSDQRVPPRGRRGRRLIHRGASLLWRGQRCPVRKVL